MAIATSSRPVGPYLILSNSASTAKDNVVVYLASPKGEIELAVDGRLTQQQLDNIGYKGWKRCEAHGAREIEKISLILSRQLFEQKKKLKVQQHLREKWTLDQLKIRCQLRAAQGYSKNDEEMNRRILARAQRSEEMLYKVIASEFDPATRDTALSLELHEASTSPVAHIGGKRQGIG